MDEMTYMMLIVVVLVIGQGALWAWVGLQAQQKLSWWPIKTDLALTADEVARPTTTPAPAPSTPAPQTISPATETPAATTAEASTTPASETPAATEDDKPAA